MLGHNSSEPALFQMVDLEALVPEDHKLRKIDSVLDLSFVPEVVGACYVHGRGRPSVDPELALRMMLLGVLYDLSDRELCDEIGMHAGMRWFCRLNFHDPVPDHSTLSRLRNERWAESGLFDCLMDEVIRQCGEAGLLSGRHLSVDGTEIRADASMKSLRRRGPKGEDGSQDPPPSGGGGGEPPARGEWEGRGEKYSKDTHVSATDPDAQLYRKDNNQGAALKYLGHDLIDTKSRVILRRNVTRATSRAEREAALEMVDEVVEGWDELGLAKRPEVLTADKGYGSSAFVRAVLDRGLEPHIPLLAKEEVEALPTWERRTLDLGRMRARQRKVKEAEARNRVRELMKTPGYTVSRKLRIRSEHVFAEGKTCHGLGRARRRGLERVQDQATLTAVVQNLKRLVAFVGRTKRGAAAAAQAGDSGIGGVWALCLRLVLAMAGYVIDEKAHGPSGWLGPVRSASQLRAAGIPHRWPEMARSSTGF
jgi:IS5 family transposase